MGPLPICTQGHTKERRPNGEWVCRPCTNAQRNARRKLERQRSCPHLGVERLEWVLATTGKMVCLACVVEEANGLRVAKLR